MPPSFGTLAAKRCLREGIAALSAREQRALANLFRDETRKGAFRLPASDILTSFCQHIVDEFPHQHTTQVVYDYLPYLRRRAKLAARSNSVPLVSLVLYATWLEHWINMVITVAMLRNQVSQTEVDRYFDSQPNFASKLAQLGPVLALPPLPRTLQGPVKKLIACRNDYVHYTWRGSHSGHAHRRHSNLRNIVLRAPELLVRLRAWEVDALDAQFRPISRRLFPLAG
jgi:hypothetical protein